MTCNLYPSSSLFADLFPSKECFSFPALHFFLFQESNLSHITQNRSKSAKPSVDWLPTAKLDTQTTFGLSHQSIILIQYSQFVKVSVYEQRQASASASALTQCLPFVYLC